MLVERGLTLHQPWCALMALGIKPLENRHRPVFGKAHLGKPIALHAGKNYHSTHPEFGKIINRALQIAPELQPRGPYSLSDDKWYKLAHVRGAILAVATPIAIIRESIDDEGCQRILFESVDDALTYDDIPLSTLRWRFQKVAYVFADVQPLPEPIPYRGMQGLWTIDGNARAAIAEQLAEVA